MKKLLILMVMMASGLSMHAQQILGKNHAMLRLAVSNRYLLLPVQEREDNATIQVMADNQMVQTLNVKLAVDHVDYYVPLDIRRYGKQNLLLDITFHGDRRFTGAMKDFLCWREIKQSDTFDTKNREHFRPVYHHTPVYGWMNDPNGMFYMPSSPSGNDGQAGAAGGVYHLYYQWNPYGSQWENMTWGHSTSTDLIHWTAQPTAIEPDALGSVFSGSCVVAPLSSPLGGRTDSPANLESLPQGGGLEEAIVAFYTSAGKVQVQSMAVSKDNGQTFEKYAGNPVLVSDQEDFRDPKAFWNEDIQKWNLILAVGQEMRIYSSKDLKEWQYESSFGKELGCHEGVWECPDLMKLPVRTDGTPSGTVAATVPDGSPSGVKTKWLLICNINPGGPFGGSATQYFVGDFDGHKFTCDHKDTRWMDYGKDHYATVTFNNAPEGRHIALAWMSNWQYANQVPTKQFRSANSVPRDLDLFEYNGQVYCGVTPSKELLALRGQVVKTLPRACEIVVDIKESAEIVLSNALGEQVVMKYDASARTFSMDRTRSYASFSEAFPCVTTAPVYGDMKQLRLFVDHCSIEAFDSEGRMAMTNLVFPQEPYNKIMVKGGKATIYGLSRLSPDPSL